MTELPAAPPKQCDHCWHAYRVIASYCCQCMSTIVGAVGRFEPYRPDRVHPEYKGGPVGCGASEHTA